MERHNTASLALEQQDAHNPDIQESMGYLAWQDNRLSEAQQRFARAVENGSRDMRMISDYAHIARASGMPASSVAEIVQRNLRLSPDDTENRLFLGELQAEAHQYSDAKASLALIHVVKPEQAYSLFSTSAYVYANLHDFTESRAFAKRALPYAKTPGEKLQIESLLSFLDTAAHPALNASAVSAGNVEGLTHPLLETTPTTLKLADERRQVRGKTKAFECEKGSFRLRVQAGDHDLVFGMTDPKDIVVRNLQNLEWSCGPLRPQDVTVIYRPSPNSKLDGFIAELVF